MFELRQLLSEEDWGRVRLVIVGGCRGPQDWKLVQDLKDLTKYLSVEDNVEFHPNLPYPDLVAEFGRATIGIHTMWNEHFGIGEFAGFILCLYPDVLIHELCSVFSLCRRG